MDTNLCQVILCFKRVGIKGGGEKYGGYLASYIGFSF